ncbi:Uncharacterized protein OBRU01_18216 [Operophtera brumata]|uniref:Uncharacterized protein n=1 Tax=Operophtera brumata TaxID=104452 RepID=A0A0L7KZF4_OPEBR|nr:Uncharacterized protein OBRU01_18216 [Operophtera brumata]
MSPAWSAYTSCTSSNLTIRGFQVHQSSSDERVAGTFSDYVSGVVGIHLVYIVKPYHQRFPGPSEQQRRARGGHVQRLCLRHGRHTPRVRHQTLPSEVSRSVRAAAKSAWRARSTTMSPAWSAYTSCTSLNLTIRGFQVHQSSSNERVAGTFSDYVSGVVGIHLVYIVHQSSSDERVAGTFSDYVSGVVGIHLVYIIKPYHQRFPNATDKKTLDVFVNKAITAVMSVVRGWRSSTKQNTLSFFGTYIEY